MNFGEQIKKLRNKENLTQQQIAEKIGVSRQAISNWENDKNLPDIEMIIFISQTFNITLDELILGGTKMNNMTKKLINDGSKNKQIKMNLTGIKIGALLLIIAFISLILGFFVPIELENYIVYIFDITLLCGVITFLVVGLKNIINLIKKNRKEIY